MLAETVVKRVSAKCSEKLCIANVCVDCSQKPQNHLILLVNLTCYFAQISVIVDICEMFIEIINLWNYNIVPEKYYPLFISRKSTQKLLLKEILAELRTNKYLCEIMSHFAQILYVGIFCEMFIETFVKGDYLVIFAELHDYYISQECSQKKDRKNISYDFIHKPLLSFFFV